MSRPFKVYRLQQIDSQLDWLSARLKDVTASLENDDDLVAAEERAAASREEFQKAKNALASADYEAQQQRIKIEQTEATLYGGKVRNPKELQDLQNESAALKRHLKVLEERQFEAMLTEEELSANHKEALEEQAKVVAQHAQRNRELEEEKQKLQNDIQRFTEERQATAATVDPADLAEYNRLREKRRGIAVAKVVDRACSACGGTLSAALLSASHSPNALNYCETCGRILYTG
ncbi:MAG: hypothetical protein IT297_03615 [Anaerolineae bacterium]|jgi:predicted  nucleic acid-binding Zn-ribbon protein|nr:hypothetical protein [Anaerolineae bacterium]MCZ7553263.1 hypothetical protein [Anaerolineales bacterium]